ncbi:unnamed protein product [Ixodes pacificus]
MQRFGMALVCLLVLAVLITNAVDASSPPSTDSTKPPNTGSSGNQQKGPNPAGRSDGRQQSTGGNAGHADGAGGSKPSQTSGMI